jgi:hypothetical protein
LFIEKRVYHRRKVLKVLSIFSECFVEIFTYATQHPLYQATQAEDIQKAGKKGNNLGTNNFSPVERP